MKPRPRKPSCLYCLWWDFWHDSPDEFSTFHPIATVVVYACMMPAIVLVAALLWPIMGPILGGILEYFNHPLSRGF